MFSPPGCCEEARSISAIDRFMLERPPVRTENREVSDKKFKDLTRRTHYADDFLLGLSCRRRVPEAAKSSNSSSLLSFRRRFLAAPSPDWSSISYLPNLVSWRYSAYPKLYADPLLV